ncbi:TrbG/VirB9 family P-type conjugative transfer protein [Aliarcobacter skirrowii]|uniref:TrbG/VirB9 family P-type conjugative transfer protein n=1 Tax=Aliarcobacter skirrowii TaxID=28200 RepID=UPI00082DDFCA|nr:TrbG/VirB9 family P-type conjugative transfer protein [Aliarcobacter skirrowii]
MKKILMIALLLIQSAYAFRDETSLSDNNTNQDMFPSSLNSVQKAFNTSNMHENVAVFKYEDENTYKVRLRTAVETMFVLPPGEKIISYSLGDSLVFKYKPIIVKNYQTENLFTVRPQTAGADTNLIVVGASGKIYKFYLRADNHDSPFLPIFTIYISKDGKIPSPKPLKADFESLEISSENKKELSHFLSNKVEMQNANFGYISLNGSDDIKPDTVFDDGKFTYFYFKSQNGKIKNLPVVYRVVDDYDTPVNSRIEGDFIIAETLSKRWTLRSGTAHHCIKRED